MHIHQDLIENYAKPRKEFVRKGHGLYLSQKGLKKLFVSIREIELKGFIL